MLRVRSLGLCRFPGIEFAGWEFQVPGLTVLGFSVQDSASGCKGGGLRNYEIGVLAGDCTRKIEDLGLRLRWWSRHSWSFHMFLPLAVWAPLIIGLHHTNAEPLTGPWRSEAVPVGNCRPLSFASM